MKTPAAEQHPGRRLREALGREVVPLIGVYDVFSAAIAARHYDGLFISGFGFAASHYGLPDIGFISWSDLVDFVRRVRAILPSPHIVVDIDDGYADVEVACHVTSLLEAAGASGIVLEDQKRPRRCGHLDGKEILPLDEFVPKLERVLAARKEMVVVARTDESDVEEIARRASAFAAAGADVVLADALRDTGCLRRLRGCGKPLAFNQLFGGKSPNRSIADLRELGASMIIYSTPCLFAAQAAVERAMRGMAERDGLLQAGDGVELKECVALLNANLAGKRTPGDERP